MLDEDERWLCRPEAIQWMNYWTNDCTDSMIWRWWSEQKVNVVVLFIHFYLTNTTQQLGLPFSVDSTALYFPLVGPFKLTVLQLTPTSLRNAATHTSRRRDSLLHFVILNLTYRPIESRALFHATCETLWLEIESLWLWISARPTQMLRGPQQVMHVTFVSTLCPYTDNCPSPRDNHVINHWPQGPSTFDGMTSEKVPTEVAYEYGP